MVSYVSSLEIISVAVTDPNFFLWIAASVVDATVVNPNDIKTLLANSFNKFFNPFFSDGLKSLPKNPPDCPILRNWVFDDFILAEELFVKAFRNLKTFVLVNNNLCRKFSSSLESPTISDETFKITSIPFFIPDSNLLIFKLDNFMFKVL